MKDKHTATPSKIFAQVIVKGAGPSGRSPAEIVGSNPTAGMDVCLL
jgi:hypothetical protein